MKWLKSEDRKYYRRFRLASNLYRFRITSTQEMNGDLIPADSKTTISDASSRQVARGQHRSETF